MSTKQIWKLVLIVIVLGIAALALYPLDKRLKPGLDLAGGTVFVYQVDIKKGDDPKTVIERVIEVLRKRVDPSGVRNLIWRPVAGNRIEIQAPLAPKETVALRKAFTAARKELTDANLSRAKIDGAVRHTPTADRNGLLDDIAGGDVELRGQLATMAEAYDALQQATDTFDQLQKQMADAEGQLKTLPEDASEHQKTQAQSQFNDLAANLETLDDSERHAEQRFAAARQAVLDWNVELDDLQTMLAPIDDWGGIKSSTREKAKKEFDRLTKALSARHPDREKVIHTVAAAFFAYAQIKGPLDDPNDLKALLRGAGVLEFRIGPSPAEVADLAAYRQRLRKQGPLSGSNLPFRWFVIDDITQFAEDAAKRQQLAKAPEVYFEEYGGNLVGQRHREDYYLLLGNSPHDDAMSKVQEGWKLVNAGYTRDSQGFPAVSFELNPAGGRLMRQMTGLEDRKGKPMAIVLDNRVITAPSIQSTLSTQILVSRGSGGFKAKDQQYLVNTLNAGTLTARLLPDPISEDTTGPEIGEDNLRRGKKAAIAALAVVALFMACYYLFGGFVADFALMANMMLILGTMATLQATFTLPGIAGIVLTIGMAVDANVLIFERIREELQQRSDIRTAVRLGYEKAMKTIVDANLTTLITCLILGYTATAEIKGFAVTLGIGIVATMFTALFCTRVIVDLAMDFTHMRSLPMLPSLIPKLGSLLRPNINWLSKRTAFFALSILLFVGSILAVASRHTDLLDIEFRSGTKVAFNLKQDNNGQPMLLTLKDVRERLDRAGRDNGIDELTLDVGPTVVTLGDTQVVGNAVQASSFSVACLSLDQRAVSDVIKREFKNELDHQTALTFAGAGKSTDAPSIQQASKRLIMPIKQAVLGKNPNIDRPDVQTDVSDYVGGVAIVLYDIKYPIMLKDLRDRISSTRQGPKFEHVKTWRPYEVIGLDAASTSGAQGELRFESAVVVIAPDSVTNYAQDDSKFYSDPYGMAAMEWQIVHEALRRDTSLDSVSHISPQVSTTMKNRAIVAMLLSLLAVVVYIWFRFGSLRYGLAAIVALVHDVVIAMGLVAMCGYLYDSPFGHALGLTDFKLNLAMVAALLTIVGYSLNDTIVIFDRIRENRGRLAIATPTIINHSIDQTISRTVLTSGTTLMAVLTLYLFGGEGVHGFAFAMLIGVCVGTYSSIAIAAPLLTIGRHSQNLALDDEA